MEADERRLSESDRLARRVARSASAISSLQSTYARAPVVFYKALDSILIGFGAPAGLRVTRVGSGHHFQTLSRAEVVSPKLYPFGRSMAFEILAHPQDRGNVGRDAETFLLALHERLAATQESEAHRRLLVTLNSGFDDAALVKERFPEPQQGGMAERDAGVQVAEVFANLDEFLTAGNYNFTFQGMSKPCPRFLFFHRYVGLDGHPSLRLHLLPSQIVRLRERLPPGLLEKFVLALARIFHPGSWTIEDNFSSGVAGWVSWPWQRRHTSGVQRLAQRVLDALCREDGSEDVSPGRLGPALVAPIHVDGLPWLTIAGLLPEGELETSDWSQDFYRDQLPYLTTTLRGMAEQAYLNAVRDKAREAVEIGRDGLGELSNALGALSAAFPFKRFSLSSIEGGSHQGVFQWRGSRAFLRYGLSESERPRVDFARLAPASVVAAIVQGEREMAAARTGQLEARLMSYVNIGHTLKNIVACTGWVAAAPAVARASHYFDAFVDRGPTPSDLAEVKVALAYADRSLSLFWIVESLGHFIRLAGAHTGNFAWTKFSDWIDVADPLEGAALLATCATAVFDVAVSIAHGLGWKRVRVAMGGGKTPIVWTGDAPPPLDIAKLHVPPFRKGCDGGFVFAFCILEPLVNAVRALFELPPDAADDAWLDIEVSLTDGGAALLVEVSNLSGRPLPATLSGLESTKAIAEEIGIGSFGEAVCTTSGCLHRITMPMRFTPRRMIDLIQIAGDHDGGESETTQATQDR